jgi:hypothetical protein
MLNYIIWKDTLTLFTASGFIFDEFKPRGLLEKHVVITQKLDSVSELLKNTGKPRNVLSRWQVEGLSGCILTSSQRPGKQNDKGGPLTFPYLTFCCFVGNMN